MVFGLSEPQMFTDVDLQCIRLQHICLGIGGSGGTAGHPLIRRLMVQSPAPPVGMLKYPWARYWHVYLCVNG